MVLSKIVGDMTTLGDWEEFDTAIMVVVIVVVAFVIIVESMEGVV